jgi:hypothetical protein
MPRLRLPRVGLQNLAIELLGRLQPAAFVMLEQNRQRFG